MTPRVSPSVTAEYTNLLGRELIHEDNMLFESRFTKGGCEIVGSLKGWTCCPLDYLSINGYFAEKPIGYREDLAPMLMKQGWPSENVLSRVMEADIETTVSMDIGGNTGFDSDAAKTNSLVHMSEGYHWRPANEEGLCALGMKGVPEEHSDNNLDGNRLEEALAEAHKESPDFDKEQWAFLKVEAKEVGESSTGIAYQKLVVARRTKIENPGAAKVRFEERSQEQYP